MHYHRSNKTQLWLLRLTLPCVAIMLLWFSNNQGLFYLITVVGLFVACVPVTNLRINGHHLCFTRFFVFGLLPLRQCASGEMLRSAELEELSETEYLSESEAWDIVPILFPVCGRRTGIQLQRHAVHSGFYPLSTEEFALVSRIKSEIEAIEKAMPIG